MGLLVTSLVGCSAPLETTAPAETLDPDIVASFGGDALTLAQFEDQYARSVGGREIAEADSLQAYQDFLERYVDFQLKVKEAKAAGLENDSTIQVEINTYREQLARPYLLERKVTDPLMRDLYEKRKEMIDASHILLRVGRGGLPADTLLVYERMSAIRDSIVAGEDFGDMAVRHSEDPSAKGSSLGARGHLGFFSGGRMVKDFEDVAFRTPVGEISEVFRTQYGYHVIYVHDRIPKPLDVRISHLMVRPNGSTAADTAAALARLDSIQTRLAAGESFADLAQEYSDDKASGEGGGDLGFISYDSRLIPAMKEAAFAAENVGDITDPILTQFGYHLIHVTDRREQKTYEESVEDLKNTLVRLPRGQQAQQAYIASIRAARGETVDSVLVAEMFNGFTADSVNMSLINGTLDAATFADTVATMGDDAYTIGDVAAFVRDNQVNRQQSGTLQFFASLDKFLDDEALRYEISLLEGRDEEFRATMDEFRQGLLLFRLMEDSVWTAAAQDTAGLKAYYEEHAGEYMFSDRTRLVGLYSSSDSLLNTYGARLDAGSSLGDLLAEADTMLINTVRIDTTYVAGPTNSVFDRGLDVEEGGHTGALPYTRGFVLLIRDGIDPARPKGFDEARAEVINGYQQILEDRLIARLRKAYGARTFPERLERAFQSSTASASSPDMPTQR